MFFFIYFDKVVKVPDILHEARISISSYFSFTAIIIICIFIHVNVITK